MILESMNWSFDLSDFDTVWKFVCQLGLLLLALLLGNVLRRVVPFLRKAFIPSALLGGFLLFILNVILKYAADYELIDMRMMQIITYHCLAIGFIAMSLKIVDKKEKAPMLQVWQNGALTGGTYMLQAVFGMLTGLIFFWAGGNLYFDAGVILPLGFGQGPGNALTWDINFTALTHSSSWENGPIFNGGGSFGLTIASIGFVVASIVGVVYINIMKRRKEIPERGNSVANRNIETFEAKNEIEDSESVDKTTIQAALIALAYAISFGIMVFFAKLTDWTGIKLFNSVAWGFNFIWGVIAATIIKTIIKALEKKKIVKKRYVNNYQMDRISGFAFDMMIIAGVAAIDITVVKEYVWVILALSVVGTIVTYVYLRLLTELCFKGYNHESFLVNFGTLTGTASNGMILLREVDPNYETPMANVFTLSQLPAMIFVAPLLLLLNMSSESLKGCYIALGIFSLLLILYTLFLVLTGKGIISFKKKEKEMNDVK